MNKKPTFVYLIAFLLLSFSIHAQSNLFEENTEKYGEGKVYYKTDERATFPGGKLKMNEYFDVKFDTRADQSKINDGAKEGYVEARFIIEPDGKVKLVEIVQSYTPSYDDEMVNTLQSMPKWEPAKKDGVSVRSFGTYKYGITFVNDGSVPSGGRKGHVVE